MKLTARDQDQQNALAHAFHDRERFVLTGAGLQAEFVAETLNRVPCLFGSGRYETNLELVQVTEATTQAAWNGEGLPPVGTVCEYQTIGATNDWKEVEILCHFTAQKEVAVFVPVQGYRNVKQATAECFRPIRTPEQIAAEERKRITDDIQQVCVDGENNGAPFHEALYLAGYRKQ